MVKGRDRRRPGARVRSPSASGSDDAGCLLLILGVLWWFGVVSFNSCTEIRVSKQLEDVQAALAGTEAHLAELTKLAEEMRLDTASLSGRHAELERQVNALEKTRDAIAIDLREAARIVDPTSKGRLYSFAEDLGTGILGNLVSHGMILVMGWFVGVRYTRRQMRQSEAGEA